MFDFKKYENQKVVMHCKTEEEAREFCLETHKAGKKWLSGCSFAEETRYLMYKDRTCYDFNRGTYCDIDSYKAKGYTILEWSDYREGEKKMSRICELLGVKEGQKFKFADNNIEYVIRDGGLCWVYGEALGATGTRILINMIEHPEQIKPGNAPLTLEQIEVLKAVYTLFGDVWIAMDLSGDVYRYEKRPKKDSGIWMPPIPSRIMAMVGGNENEAFASFLSHDDAEPLNVLQTLKDNGVEVNSEQSV